MARRNNRNRNAWPKVAVVVASAAVLVAGSLPAPAHAARALMQQPQQPQAPPQAIGDLLGALGLGNNNNQNPNQNSLASVIDRAIATGIPPQQRVREDDGTTQTISARDGNSRSSASASGDVTSVDAGADDGRDDTQEQVTRRGSRNDDRIAGDDDVARQQEPTAAVQPATSASRASASSSSAVAPGPDDTTDYPEEEQEIDDPDSPDAPQDFDESDGQQEEEDADEDASFGAAAAGSNANANATDATDAGLQRAAAGVNGTYGALAGLLSNLTGGALQLPPLDTTGSNNNANANNAVRSAPVTELAPGVVGSSAAKAASSLVAAAAGAVALVMVMVV